MFVSVDDLVNTTICAKKAKEIWLLQLMLGVFSAIRENDFKERAILAVKAVSQNNCQTQRTRNTLSRSFYIQELQNLELTATLAA